MRVKLVGDPGGSSAVAVTTIYGHIFIFFFPLFFSFLQVFSLFFLIPNVPKSLETSASLLQSVGASVRDRATTESSYRYTSFAFILLYNNLGLD